MFGVAYYPEYMPYERMDQDFAMMKKAGINTIRVAESTWSTLEPLDGIFDFHYIDQILEKAQAAELDVIVGTPTYAIPAWLAKKGSLHYGDKCAWTGEIWPPPDF